jgi:hypothetical protein
MAFSMGQNFLNSPGAQLLGAMGIHLPGSQPQVDPMQGMQVPQGGFQPGPAIDPNAGAAPMQDLPAIPKPPHGGLFHRIASAMMGMG